MAGFILVWRTAIIWTLGRTGLTAVVSVVPFVQIVFNKPLWNAGCISDDVLRAGQHYTSCGLWSWLVVWLWWGMESWIMRNQFSTNDSSQRLAWLARLGASLGMLPTIFGLWLIVSVFLSTVLNVTWTPLGLCWSYLICALVALVGWFLIWRRAVNWSEGSFAKTIGAWVLFVGLPIAGQFLGSGGNTVKDISIVVAPVIGWGIWMAWTMWYWPMRVEAGVADGPICMKCGYSLQGLKATRCPECGDEPTLDELWAASCSAPP